MFGADFRGYFEKMAQELGFAHILQKFESDYTYSEGFRLHLDVIEVDHNAPTIVFIPGTAVYALCYAEFLALVADSGYNVVGFDPRGHGQSEGTRGDYTIQEIVRDTQAVITYAIEHFNEEVSVVGTSQGGIVAFYLAGVEDRVKSIVCQNFADLSDASSAQLTNRPMLIKFTKPLLFKLSGYLPNISLPISAYVNIEQEPIRHFGTVGQFLRKDPLALKTIKLRALRSLASSKPFKKPEAINIPTLVLQPGQDNIFPVSYTKKLFKRLRCKKRLVIFKNFTHTMMIDEVAAVTTFVIKWLDEIHPKNDPQKIDLHKKVRKLQAG